MTENRCPHCLAALDADKSAQTLRHAARELQYIVDAGPCNLSDQHISGETLACIQLTEELLGPMRDWPDEPNASGVLARRYFAEKGERP